MSGKSYFEDKGMAEIFMICAIIVMYDVIYHFSKVLGIHSWVDIGFDFSIPYEPPTTTYGVAAFFIMCIFLVVSFRYLQKKIYFLREKKKMKISEIKNVYIKYFCTYFFGVLLMIVFVPIIMPIIRGWR